MRHQLHRCISSTSSLRTARLLLVSLGVVLAAGCASTPPPYVEQVWSAGSYSTRDLGIKGGGISYEQIVLYENGYYAWLRTFTHLVDHSTYVFSKGHWETDARGTFLVTRKGKLYLSTLTVQLGNRDIEKPYVAHFEQQFNADRQVGAPGRTGAP